MEIGSFIELQLPQAGEWFDSISEKRIARLNSGRAAIYYALSLTGCKELWVPYYQCESVRDFLSRKHIKIRYYHIDKDFSPVDIRQAENEAVLIVNYFGIFSSEKIQNIAASYKHVIIDNSQAFFSLPLENCYNVYSARKFIGVPDGAYVIGDGADRLIEKYKKGYSSDTSLFLLQRIEYGCEGKAYQSRQLNEQRIDKEDVMQMSSLTQYILRGTDYLRIKKKRKENFELVNSQLKNINSIHVMQYDSELNVPMVYPLLIENDGILEYLLKLGHYQGRWWNYIREELPEHVFEHYLARYMIPITIDQRYDREILKTLCEAILLFVESSGNTWEKEQG